MITINGERYKVIEDLGFSHDVGCRAKVVQCPEGERVAIWKYGKWVWHKAEIRPIGKVEGQ